VVNKAIFPGNGSFGTSIKNEITDKLTTNLAGGQAYESPEKHAIAQIACTGCFNDTFYADAASSLEQMKKLVSSVMSQPGGPEFIGKVALYSRTQSHMKDMPAYLCASLAVNGLPQATHVLKSVFNRCIDNGKMLRNFLQICRSGSLGKKINVSRRSIKTLVNNWFSIRSANTLFDASIGNDPNMADILKMCHVRPNTVEKEALFRYILGKEYNYNELPEKIRELEFFKANPGTEVPQDLDFRMLDSICTKDQMRSLWTNQLTKGNWHLIRMNLNNLLKYGVFESKTNVEHASRVLGSREKVQMNKVFPYQIFNTYMNIKEEMPREIKDALHDALEHSLVNVPKLEGQVYICVDISGSMGSVVTGNRGSASSTVRCVDVAALFGCAILRNNPSAKIIPFNTSARDVSFEPRDSVMTNTQKLASMLSGGTDCSAPLRYINSLSSKVNLKEKVLNSSKSTIIMVSDNESWWGDYADSLQTRTQQEWKEYKKYNPQAKLICIDLTPTNTHTVATQSDVLKVGGFSDSVFSVIKNFSENSFAKDSWTTIIDNVTI